MSKWAWKIRFPILRGLSATENQKKCSDYEPDHASNGEDEGVPNRGSNRTYSRKTTLSNYLAFMQWTKGRAVRLMDVIRKQYRL